MSHAQQVVITVHGDDINKVEAYGTTVERFVKVAVLEALAVLPDPPALGEVASRLLEQEAAAAGADVVEEVPHDKPPFSPSPPPPPPDKASLGRRR